MKTGWVEVGFDSVGYAAGRDALPRVASIWQVRPSGADDTELLQTAIDELSARSRVMKNFRGALSLVPGTFRVEGQLRVAASGIVICGSSDRDHATRIIATGKGRRALFEIGSSVAPGLAESTALATEFVPAGSRTFSLVDVTGFKVGDRVVVQRPSTREWIASLGMDQASGPFAEERTHWLPGSRDLRWNRVITALSPQDKTITLDAPITAALDRYYGGGTVARVVSGAPLSQVGLENLVLESDYDRQKAKDEEHAWIAVHLDRIEDAWVHRVTARHFVGSAVQVGPDARRVTVQECRSESPVSEIGGYRRRSFLVYGQQALVRNCMAESGLNDFAVGFGAAGPNVFRDCDARGALGPSGAAESWASGVLYERVRVQGSGLRLTREDDWTQGGGWTSANSALVDCEAEELVANGPEGFENVVAHGSGAEEKAGIAEDEESCPVTAPFFSWSPTPVPRINADSLPRLEIIRGRFVIGGRTVWGGQVNAGGWKGQLSSRAAEDAGVSITRFAPGRKGAGLTEDLPELAARMRREGTPFYGGGPGLWYDRRRDDHLIAARPDGRVWAPFYEMPWARSGQGTAWDGLSQYDLTQFNPWYFERTREFAGLCAEQGLVLYHHLYNTHNLLESPAHWVDFPWRPCNCINDTGLSDPPLPEAGQGIRLAEALYSVGHAGRRELHRAYIRHNLEQLGDCSHVVFSLAYQFAGPRTFQEFFLDTVAEWERETGRRVKISLVTSKDITDAILSDPVRSAQISVVDMRYWQTQPDGTVWAPRGDRNRAFREMTWEQFGSPYGDTPPPTTPRLVYQQVRDYGRLYPDKVLVAWNGDCGPWPILMAGGAQALMRNPASGQSQGIVSDQTPLDAFVREHLSGVLMDLLPRDGWLADSGDNWCLADDEGRGVLIYSLSGTRISWDRQLPTSPYTGVWFNPRHGSIQGTELPQGWNSSEGLLKPTSEEWVLWLQAK